MHILSHVGIEGNEEVHKLAKSAEIYITQTLQNPNNIKNILYQAHLASWQNQWDINTENKLFIHKKSALPWKKLPLLKRTDEIIITCLRIGHTKITHSHLYLRDTKSMWSILQL